MDRPSHRPSNTSALFAAMQPPETENGLSTAQSVDGGVPVTHHFMDDDIGKWRMRYPGIRGMVGLCLRSRSRTKVDLKG